MVSQHPRRAIAFGAIASVLPDLDVLAFRFDIAYGATFGHRGFSFPWRPIRVSPLNPERFFTSRGAAVLASELAWVWIPCAVAGLVGKFRARN